MTKVRGNVEASLVGDAPSAETLIRIGLGANGGSEKVHPPLRTPSLAVVDVEDAQRDLDVADPELGRLVQLGGGGKAVGGGIRDEEVVKGSSSGADLGRVVHHGLVRHVVGVDLELEVRLRVVGALVDEGLHHLVHPDVVVGGLRLIEEEVDLVARGELDLNVRVRVAQADLRPGKGLLVGHSLVVLDCADARAGRHGDAGDLGIAVHRRGEDSGGRGCDH